MKAKSVISLSVLFNWPAALYNKTNGIISKLEAFNFGGCKTDCVSIRYSLKHTAEAIAKVMKEGYELRNFPLKVTLKMSCRFLKLKRHL